MKPHKQRGRYRSQVILSQTFFRIRIGLLLGVSLCLSGTATSVVSQDAPPRIVASEVELLSQTRSVLRGLLQNELGVVCRVSDLDVDSAHKLLARVQDDWERLLLTPTIARLKANTRLGPTLQGEVDRVVEQAMMAWVQEVLGEDAAARYIVEINDRDEFRKEATIEQLLVLLQQRVQMADSQVEEARRLLQENWRVSWFRTLENVFENESLMPQINRQLLDPILTKHQRGAVISKVTLNNIEAPLKYYSLLSDETPLSLPPNFMQTRAETSKQPESQAPTRARGD